MYATTIIDILRDHSNNTAHVATQVYTTRDSVAQRVKFEGLNFRGCTSTSNIAKINPPRNIPAIRYQQANLHNGLKITYVHKQLLIKHLKGVFYCYNSNHLKTDCSSYVAVQRSVGCLVVEALFLALKAIFLLQE